MMQVGTVLQITDNTGGRYAQCVKVLQKTKGKVASSGDLMVVSVKALVRKHRGKIKKGHLYKTLVCETKKVLRRKDGSGIRCARNTAVLCSPTLSPLGSRIAGITPYELRLKGHTKVLSLSAANI